MTQETKRLTLRLPASIHKQISIEADFKCRSMNTAVLDILMAYFDKKQKKL